MVMKVLLGLGIVALMLLGTTREEVYLLLFDSKMGLLSCAPISAGTVTTVNLQPRMILEPAYAARAACVVLAHNHPRGTLRPSREDLACTLRALNAVAPLRIPLLDHIIVVRDGAVSIRESGMIPDVLWTTPAQNSRIVQSWLDGATIADDTQ